MVERCTKCGEIWPKCQCKDSPPTMAEREKRFLTDEERELGAKFVAFIQVWRVMLEGITDIAEHSKSSESAELIAEAAIKLDEINTLMKQCFEKEFANEESTDQG